MDMVALHVTLALTLTRQCRRRYWRVLFADVNQETKGPMAWTKCTSLDCVHFNQTCPVVRLGVTSGSFLSLFFSKWIHTNPRMAGNSHSIDTLRCLRKTEFIRRKQRLQSCCFHELCTSSAPETMFIGHVS